MELSVQTKTYLVLGIMVCCFALLYPKIFHPMLMAGLGMRQSQAPGQSGPDWAESGHPRLRRPPHVSGGPGAGPGPRMAAEHAAAHQQQRQGGGKGNVVGLILPVYAIGIVLYLVYTLVKVMGGFKSKQQQQQQQQQQRAKGQSGSEGKGGGEALNDYYKNFHFDPLSGEFVDRGGRQRGGGGVCDEEAEDQQFPAVDPEQTRYERMHRDLEKLLRRVDDQDISENELVQLRSRLEETEKQMTSILNAMQNLQQRQPAASAAAAAGEPETETRQRKAFNQGD